MEMRTCGKCGRSVAIRRAPNCMYCGAPLDAPPESFHAGGVEDPLVPRLRSCFVLLQRCRTDGDLGPALPWLAPPLQQQLQQEIDEDRRASVRHVIDRVAVGAIEIKDDGPDKIAQMELLYAEYWQDVRGHMILRGLRSAKPHRELWRLAPSQNPGAPVAMQPEDRCTGCGADLGSSMGGKCPYCGLVPIIDRLGMTLLDIDRADPAQVYEEWKHRIAAARFSSGAAPFLTGTTEDDPLNGFWRGLESLFRDD